MIRARYLNGWLSSRAKAGRRCTVAIPRRRSLRLFERRPYAPSQVQDGATAHCCSTARSAPAAARANQPIADLVAEARQIAAEGRKIVITVSIRGFRPYDGEKFIDLRALDVDGIEHTVFRRSSRIS